MGLWTTLLCIHAAHGTVVADWDLVEVLRRADAVVIGTVTRQEVVHLRGLPLTESTVAVERALYGAPGASLVVTQLGGGDAIVAGDVHLQPGQRVLLATSRRHGRHTIVGLVLGAWRVEPGGLIVQRIDVALLGADGRMREPPGHRELTLESIEAALAGMAR